MTYDELMNERRRLLSYAAHLEAENRAVVKRWQEADSEARAFREELAMCPEGHLVEPPLDTGECERQQIAPEPDNGIPAGTWLAACAGGLFVWGLGFWAIYHWWPL